MSDAALLVLHGGHADRLDIREAVERLRRDGLDVEVRVTWEAGHAGLFTREGAEAGRRVVAGGGDGTIHEVAQELYEHDGAVMGILPLGTANDFATSLGVPTADVEAALRLAVTGENVHPVDAIRVDDEVVVNLATAGPATRVTVETPDGLKRALGELSYAVSGIARLPALQGQEGTVRAPELDWSGRFLAVAVGNGSQAGGGVILCPDARIDDGLLDIRVVPEGDGAGALLLDSLLRGRDTVLDEASFGHRASWVEIETAEPLYVNLDGEPVEGTRFRFEVEASALRLVLPAGSPLLASG